MKPSDSDQPKSEAQTQPAPPAEPAKAPEDGKSAAQKYVFKVLPANPKNAFDFEDVADK